MFDWQLQRGVELIAPSFNALPFTRIDKIERDALASRSGS